MKKRILIADDEVCWLSSHKEILDASFSDMFEIDFVSSAEEALQAVNDNVPDLLITDLQMEEVENESCAGEYLIKKIKQKYHNVKIIIVSGAPDIEKIAERNSAEKYVPKWALMNYPIALEMSVSEVLNIKIKKC